MNLNVKLEIDTASIIVVYLLLTLLW